jgi:hypothetical protein
LLCSLALLLVTPSLIAQPRTDNGVDAVVSFTVGEGSGIGREPEYFPANVLGLPDTTARRDAASVDPKQILSLGLGGEILLRFDRHLIVDGPGADFTVFENAFAYTIGPKERIYAEPAEVSVSRDGITFLPFPFDSLTLKGCAGVTPTNGDRDPTDPEVSGGDSFDLASLGIDSVRFIRIRDVTSIVKENRGSPFWDMTLNGFDLDAVVAVNVAIPAAANVGALHGTEASMTIAPNPFSSSTEILFMLKQPALVRVRLFNLLGDETVMVDEEMEAGSHRLRLDARALPNGLYRIAMEAGGELLSTSTVQVAR